MVIDSDNLVLFSERLELKSFSKEMITDEYLSWLNDKELMKYSEQRHKTHNKDSAIIYLDSFKNTRNMFLGIFTMEERSLVGTMTAYHDINNNIVDLGILVGSKKFKSSGIGFEAWSTLMDYFANQRVRLITAGAMANNKPMISIFKKSGMSEAGIRRNHYIYKNKPICLVYFSKKVS